MGDEMGIFTEAVVFGLTLVAFVLGLSSIIMGFLPQNAEMDVKVRSRVEYGFFGVTGIVFCLLGMYLLS